MALRGYLSLAAAASVIMAMASPAAAKPKAKSAAPAAARSAALPSSVVPQAGLLPDMSLGNPKAPITVVEYASAACPHCAEWNRDSWPAFRDKYVATGKVRYVFREILTSPVEYALSAFLIGRCAVAKSKTPGNATPYFTVVDIFFKGQEGYYKTGDLEPIGKQVQARTGLDQMAQLDCVTDEKQMDAFYKTMNAHAAADKIKRTPTFVVNGKPVEGHELKDLETAIAAAQ